MNQNTLFVEVATKGGNLVLNNMQPTLSNGNNHHKVKKSLEDIREILENQKIPTSYRLTEMAELLFLRYNSNTDVIVFLHDGELITEYHFVVGAVRPTVTSIITESDLNYITDLIKEL